MSTPKDLLTIDSLSDTDIRSILKGAAEMKQVFCSGKTHPALAGKSVLTLFYEPSTRTRSSFELAARRLQADVTTFTVATSSVVKGESVHDTIDTLMSMHMDYIIVRHKNSGIPAVIGRHAKASVINAGDGAHAHPSQAFLDAFTLQEKYGELSGKRVVIIGDILHSRVARSTSTILKRLGAAVAYMGPGPLVPQEKFTGIPRFTNWDAVFEWKPDVIYLLRVQNERMDTPFFPSSDYHNAFGVTEERLKRIDDLDLSIMHPGPVNRGVELCDSAMEYRNSLICNQVENGVAARMSILSYLTPRTQNND
ncbi:MAG: aspartate carbamoyltransferase catalytic subunit [Akkermansiaceae bacterium]|nr:aspartate carbamoyltransferase catalytic subunit [Akkermansiaceae bacterium]